MFNEHEFIYRWKSTDFSTFNEIDIREDFIRDLLYILGYSKNTINNIVREKTLDISEPFHRIGRKRVQIDYVPTIRLKSFWILEAKPGNINEMDVGDMLQAYLYATHPEIQVPYIVLCNGWALDIYDVYDREGWNKPFFSISNINCDKKFEELKNILSADKMLSFQRKKLLKQVEDTFEVEFDLSQYSDFKREFNKLGTKLEKQIKMNKQEIWRNAYSRTIKEEDRRIREASAKELIRLMDTLGYASGKYHVEYYERIVLAKPGERTDLLRLLHQHYLGRPHSIYRINCMLILQEVVNNNIVVEESMYVRQPEEFLKMVIIDNLTYSSNKDMHNALAHMDKLCCKVSALIIKNGFMDLFHKIKIEKIKCMPTEEKIVREPTVAKLLVPMITMYAELLWRQYSSGSSIDKMWEFNWTLMKLIENIEKICDIPKYPDDDSDLLWYEYYSDTNDLLYTITIRHLRSNAIFYKEIDDNFSRFIDGIDEDVIKLMPKPLLIPNNEFKYDENIIQDIYTLALKAYVMVRDFI